MSAPVRDNRISALYAAGSAPSFTMATLPSSTKRDTPQRGLRVITQMTRTETSTSRKNSISALFCLWRNDWPYNLSKALAKPCMDSTGKR